MTKYGVCYPLTSMRKLFILISDSDIRYPISDIRSVRLGFIRYPIPDRKITIRRPIGQIYAISIKHQLI